jgi:SNW domain-containing protein 1
MHRGGAGRLTGEALFDSRLFNQTAGLDSGFAADDEYGVYTKSMFDRGSGGGVYRPRGDDSDVYGDVDAQLAKLSDTGRFAPDKGFAGTEGGAPKGGMKRTEPVQFERPKEKRAGDDDEDDVRKKARKDW